jgi:hypothetical protein
MMIHKEWNSWSELLTLVLGQKQIGPLGESCN